MKVIRLTSKRQATFPKALCDQMGLKAGDSLELDQQLIDGKQVWVLKPAKDTPLPERPWFGIAREFARNVEDHSMEAVRGSITQGKKASPDDEGSDA